MASKDPFNFANSQAVAPIPCIECGNNMQCVRRQPMAAGEAQSFICAACGHACERTVGVQDSDEAIQQAVERSLGILHKAM